MKRIVLLLLLCACGTREKQLAADLERCQRNTPPGYTVVIIDRGSGFNTWCMYAPQPPVR